ncbi:MAG: haloacid dehalogenase-like hydrolase [Planctomycetes bacterium]|nr:haloacid dehalogenase-like hydrolase [Planctomycetota bacterium]
MTRKYIKVAIAYDFDGTLAPGNMQDHTLLPEHLGVTPSDFWAQVKREREHDDADEILTYMRLLVQTARSKSCSVTAEVLRDHGAKIRLFRGLPEWFPRINLHGLERGLEIEHYVISSGLEEMVSATPVAAHVVRTFASKFGYDQAGSAAWPAVAVNYTTKTQYLFRINKGVRNHWNNEALNKWVPMDERPLPFSRMVYLGDGDTDIPAMKMVRHQGGSAIAVFDPQKWEDRSHQSRMFKLIAEDRANFVTPADYGDGSQLDVTVKGILERIAVRDAGYRA